VAGAAGTGGIPSLWTTGGSADVGTGIKYNNIYRGE